MCRKLTAVSGGISVIEARLCAKGPTTDVGAPIPDDSLFEQIIEAAPNALILVDSDGRIILVNAEAERLFGYSRSDLLCMPIDRLVPSAARDHHPELRKTYLRRPRARAMGVGQELYGVTRDGREVPVEIGLKPIKSNGHHCVLASIIDITERKRHEDRFRRVVEAAPNAMVEVNSSGRVVLVNTQAERLFGYSREEMLGQSVEMLLPSRARAAHPKMRATYLEAPSSRAMGAGRDLFGMTKDGREVPIEIGLNPIQTDTGNFVLAAIIDISERRAHEAALRDREARVSAIVSQSNDAIIGIDLDGRVTHWNAAAEKMFGYCAGSAIGELTVGLIVPLDCASEERHILDRVRSGNVVPHFECLRRRKDGSKLHVSVTASPVRLPDGQIVGAAKIVRDITEQKRARDEQEVLTRSLEAQVRETRDALDTLRAAQNQLVESEKMASLGGLVAGVAHEINTPVGVGVTAASHLVDEARRLERAIDEGSLTRRAFRDFVEVSRTSSQLILSNLERAADLIKSFKRVAVDQSSEEWRRVEVGQYIEEVLSSLRPQLKHTPHRVKLTCEGDTLINTNPGAWSQVITNLVMNAVVHGFEEGSPGTMTITLQREADFLHVRFSDNGRGMTQAVRDHAFDPFFTTRRGQGGSGLGLNIVFNLVNQTLGGKITLASRPGEGCTFDIKVPVQRRTPEY